MRTLSTAGTMKLTLQEQRILRDLADSTSTVRRGRKAANYKETREKRLAQYKQVGDLINRYEAYIANNE